MRQLDRLQRVYCLWRLGFGPSRRLLIGWFPVVRFALIKDVDQGITSYVYNKNKARVPLFLVSLCLYYLAAAAHANAIMCSRYCGSTSEECHVLQETLQTQMATIINVVAITLPAYYFPLHGGCASLWRAVSEARCNNCHAECGYDTTKAERTAVRGMERFVDCQKYPSSSSALSIPPPPTSRTLPLCDDNSLATDVSSILALFSV